MKPYIERQSGNVIRHDMVTHHVHNVRSTDLSKTIEECQFDIDYGPYPGTTPAVECEGVLYFCDRD